MTDPISAELLQKLRQTITEATPGRCENRNGLIYKGGKCWYEEDSVLEREAEDIALIVAAVNTLPALLDEVERLRSKEAALKVAIRDLTEANHRHQPEGGAAPATVARLHDWLWDIAMSLDEAKRFDRIDEEAHQRIRTILDAAGIVGHRSPRQQESGAVAVDDAMVERACAAFGGPSYVTWDDDEKCEPRERMRVALAAALKGKA